MRNNLGIKKLNVDKTSFKPLTTLKQNDDLTVTLELYKEDQVFNITGQSVTITALRADKVKVEQTSGYVINNNKLTINFLNTMFGYPGISEIDINFKDSAGAMTCLSFFIKVDKKADGIIKVENNNNSNTGNNNTNTGTGTNEDINNLSVRVSLLENELNKLINNNSSYSGAINSLNTTVNNLSTTVNTLNNKVGSLENELSKLLNRIISLENNTNTTPPTDTTPPAETPPTDTTPPQETPTPVKTNILPKFEATEWTYIDGATNINKNGYSVNFTTPTAWEGVSLWGWNDIKEGDTITIGVSGTSENVRLQLWANETDILQFETGTGAREKTITIPASSNGYDLSIVSNTASSTIRIDEIFVYKNNSSSGGSTGGGSNTITTVDPYPLLGKQVGYRKVKESSELASNNVIVATATEFKNAVSNATAGKTIYVRAGNYNLGSLNISKSGTSSSYITIKNYPGETPVITGSQIIFTSSAKYINFEGFLIKDLTGHWIACVKFNGGSSNINFRNNEVTNIKQQKPSASENSGCNPVVLYGDTSTPISNITIENNYIHDCDTGWSEALTAEGNVTDCYLLQNTIDNCQNIGIDLAGNFEWTGTVGSSTNQARNILVARNLVMNCQSPYATSAGLYCDGGRDNIFEYNVVYHSQCGIELGAEEPGATVENFHVRNNLIIDCGRSIGVGGYQDTSATHRNSYIYNNTIIGKDGQAENCGLLLERTSNVEFINNIVVGQSSKFEFFAAGKGTNVTRANNLYYKPGGSLPSGESNSIFSNPGLKNLTYDLTGNFTLSDGSAAIDKGKDLTEDKRGTVDLLGNTRLKNNKLDIGAYEY